MVLMLLLFACNMLKLVGLIDVESQITLELNDLALSDLVLIKIFLRLLLLLLVGLHQGIIQFDELLHLSKGFSGNFFAHRLLLDISLSIAQIFTH